MTQLVRNPPTMWETWVQSRGWEEPLEGTATHPSILAWRTLRTIADGVAKSQAYCGDFHFPGTHEILCCPVRAKCPFLPVPWAPAVRPCWPLKPSVLGTTLHGPRPPRWGAFRGAQNSHTCGRTSAIQSFSSFCVAHPWSMRSDYFMSSFLHLVVFLLSVFSCLKNFSERFWSFSLMLVLQVIVVWVCSGEQVSLGSFYSAILATLPSSVFLMVYPLIFILECHPSYLTFLPSWGLCIYFCYHSMQNIEK